MPGGLTRVAADDTVRALSMQSGASSKDAWVSVARLTNLKYIIIT